MNENDDFLTPQGPSSQTLDTEDNGMNGDFNVSSDFSPAVEVSGAARTILVSRPKIKPAFEPGPVFAAVLLAKPTKAQNQAYDAALKLARSHTHSLARLQARLILLVAAEAAWHHEAKLLGFNPRTGKPTNSKHLLGQSKTTAKNGQKVKGVVPLSAAGQQLVVLLHLTTPAKLAELQLTVSDGHGKQSSETLHVP
jgi:hypothetical protein